LIDVLLYGAVIEFGLFGVFKEHPRAGWEDIVFSYIGVTIFA